MTRSSSLSAGAIVALVALAGCAGPNATRVGTQPDEMTAEQHRAAAREHGQFARQGPYLRGRAWAPWTYSWDPGTDHLVVRDAHLAAAEVLEARYREACGELPIDAESRSPLARYSLSASSIDDGVLVVVDPQAGDPAQILASIRCHRAWLVRGGRPGNVEDLVALDDLQYQVAVRDEIVELRVTASNPDDLVELRRRAGFAVTSSAQVQPSP